MGRDARRRLERPPAAAPKGIVLERGDYCELSMLGERAMRLEHEARAAAAAFAQKIAEVQARSNALLVKLGAQHGFDPRGVFRLDDASGSLVIEESQTVT